MQKGDEPLRSFGDLLQFFDTAPEVEEKKTEKPVAEVDSKQVEASDSQDDKATPANPASSEGERTSSGVVEAGPEASSGEADSSQVTPQTSEVKQESKDQDDPDSPPAESSPEADNPTL
jgi:hypothetical protein